ncbi:hypothetical protein CMK14_11110 [Candidatus Poribacteria bacterium]|nr:hypothetical protein [Candidatus Poribacteria bacterium]
MGEVKLKNSTTATLLTVGAAFPLGLPLFQGYGQIYNGQYLKAAGFFVNAVIGGNIFMGSEAMDSNTMAVIGAGMVLTGYVLSIIDANLSAKKINQKRLKSGTNNLNSAPPQILIGSYNVRF